MASLFDAFILTLGRNIIYRTVSVVSSCFKNGYNAWLDSKLEERDRLVFHHVLFFPDSRLVCQDFFSPIGCTSKKCRNAHYKTSLSELLEYLKEAKISIDICMFTISCHELANAAVELHKLGIIVRIITNEEHEALTGSQIERFHREGIRVRHDKSSFFMHHKFVIVDSGTLVTGSFNWTRQAVTGNRENVLVTNNPDIVQPYMKEFEKLWNAYQPKCNR